MGHLSETPTDEITTRSDFRSRNRQLAATMSKERRTYLPRIVGDKVMMPADLKRLHKYMLDVEHIGIISNEMREVVARGRASACQRRHAHRQIRRRVRLPLLDLRRHRHRAIYVVAKRSKTLGKTVVRCRISDVRFGSEAAR